MHGAKLATDTLDDRKICGRQAFCSGRSMSARIYGPTRIEDPGGSRILAELESLSPEGQGFLGNANQPRVNWS